MAFLRKLGNILKQTTNGHGSLSSPSLFQAIRCMSSSKLFIGGIEYGMNEDSLREAFSKYGEVVETRVILDRETGRSRGFGFVTFTSAEEASSAIQALDGHDLHGRIVKVNYAHDRTSGGGYGGNAGSYGGGGGNYGGGDAGGCGGNAGADLYGGGGYANAGAAGGYTGSSGYGSGNTYGSNNGGLAGDNQFGGNLVANSSQFGGEQAQFGGMENVPVGDFADDTDVAKRA